MNRSSDPEEPDQINVKIKHRIALRDDDRFWLEIDRLGLHYDRGDSNNVLRLAINVLNVTEDQPEWPEVERLVAIFCSGGHSVSNLFTKAELDTAKWLHLSALGHHGYPQPEENFGYQEATYDVREFCPTCGIGGTQKAPFRIRTEFKASRSQMGGAPLRRRLNLPRFPARRAGMTVARPWPAAAWDARTVACSRGSARDGSARVRGGHPHNFARSRGSGE